MENLFRLFQPDGRTWLKGNTHTHTTCSDGTRTPEEAVRWYQEAGYDFVFLTEHEQKLKTPQALPDFVGLSAEKFLVLPGMEFYLDLDRPPDRTIHVVSLGSTPAGVWKPDWSLRKMIEFISGEGALAVIGHPYYSALSHPEIIESRAACAVEVFNTTCDAACGKGFSRSYWDFLLRNNIPIRGIASDDAHWCRQVPDYGQGWVSVKTEQFSQAGILQALRSGDFYSSMGPEFLDVSLEGTTVSVRTSPVKQINFISDNGYSSVEHAVGGKLLTAAQRELTSFRKFLRVECVDTEGRLAWTNAIML